MDSKKTRIIHWNADGLSKEKVTLLKTLCALQKPEVLLISETHLKAGSKFKFPYYQVYRQDETSPRDGRAYRGLATLVRRNVPHQQLPTRKLQSGYALGVEIAVDRNPTRVFAFYKPHGNRLTVNDINDLLDPSHPTIVAGDFNCKHTAWNSSKICPNGRRLFEDSETKGYEVLGPEVPTHYPYPADHCPDVIDLTLTHRLPNRPRVTVLDDHLMSEHQPILVELGLSTTKRPPQPPRKILNWDKFQELVDMNIPNQPVTSAREVDDLASKINDCLRNCLKSATSETPQTPRQFTISSHIMKMIEDKRKLRRQWQRSRCPLMKTQLNSMARKVSEALTTVAAEEWQKTIDAAEDSWTSIHRLCRNLAGTPEPIRPLQATDGTPRYRAEDRADIFAESLEKQFRPNPIQEPEHAEEITKYLEEYFAESITAEEDPVIITPGQVQRTLRRLKLKKAPGADQIPNEALRRLPQKAVAALTRLFNGIMRTGHFPQIWKLGHVLMLPKPGKNVLKPESYRPITLLPTVSKVFERLLLRHLIPHIQPRPEQFGFRTEHSTTLQLTRVIHHITEATNKKEHTVAVLLDMEKAFDRVWHSGLIYKLATSTTPRRIVKTVASFLEDRSFQVKVEGSLSKACPIKAGVPQGSCLSPVCYARYTDDIPVEGESKLALYADDAAYYRSSIKVKFAASKMQETLDALPKWLAQWRLSINVAKTQAILFSGCRIFPPKLQLYGREIEWTPQAKYLGVTLDRQLTMGPHIKEVINKTRVARALLHPVLTSTLPLQTKISIYKTYVRSRLTYAAPSWYALTAESQKKLLRSQQSQTMRTIVAAPRYVRNAVVERDLKIESLDSYISRLTTTMFGRTENSQHQHLIDIAPHHARPPDKKKFPRDLTKKEAGTD